jgi:WD40 repeat protein
VRALAVLPDGRLASGAGDHTVKLWNVASGECERTLVSHGGRVMALAVLPDGRLTSGAQDGTIKLWNLASGECERTLEGHRGPVRALALLPGRLTSGADDHSVRVWSRCFETNAWRNSVGFVADSAIDCLAYCSSARLLIAGDTAGRLHFLKVERGDERTNTAPSLDSA